MQYLTRAAMLTTPSNLPSLAQMSWEVKGETEKNRETEGDEGAGGEERRGMCLRNSPCQQSRTRLKVIVGRV